MGAWHIPPISFLNAVKMHTQCCKNHTIFLCDCPYTPGVPSGLFVQGLPQRNGGTRTGGKILLRNCVKTPYVQHTAYTLTHRKWRSKPSRPLMSEGAGELKRTCPICPPPDLNKIAI